MTLSVLLQITKEFYFSSEEGETNLKINVNDEYIYLAIELCEINHLVTTLKGLFA